MPFFLSLHFLFFTKPKSQPLWPDNQPISDD